MSDDEVMEVGSDDGCVITDYDQEISDLKKEIEKVENKWNFSLKNKLLEYLNKNGDFEELASLRSEYIVSVPLSSQNWLNFIKESREAGSKAEEVAVLFKKAIADSNDVDVWMENIFFASSLTIEYVREVCEQALSAVGTRFDNGGHTWLTYISMEKTKLEELQDEKEREQSIDLILNLFKRALRVPNRSCQMILQEAQEFCEELGDNTKFMELRTIYNATSKKVQKLEEFEKLIDDEETKIEGFQKFLDYENGNGDMGRIQSLHERIVNEYSEDEYSWAAYGSWCEQKLKVHTVTCDVYERAIRHCPFSCLLHQQCLLAFERAQQPNEKIDNTWNYAKNNVISTAEDVRGLYRSYIYLLKRRITAEGSTDFSPVAEVFEEGAQLLNEFGLSGDPRGEYRQNQAYFYASVVGNMDKTREIWEDILSSGFGKNAQKWIDAVKIERQFGNDDFVRKYLNKALNSVSDNINDIYEYYVQFEREEGSLQQLDMVLEKVNSQVAHRAARPQKKVVEKKEKPVMATKRAHENQPPAKRAKQNETGFRAPVKSAKEQSHSEPSNAQPPPQASSSNTEEANRTVFVSNLDFGTTEDDVRSVIEGVEKIRFAKRAKSELHRGFGYVVLANGEKLKEALKKDRVLVNGRPMFISENDPEKRVGFKYSTELEKTKLFVRNVHFKASEEDLKAIFTKFGPVASVRLVRHKNGQPKGVAFVEFENEEGCTAALAEKEIMLKDRTLHVALSNPPPKDSKKKDFDDEKLENGQRKGHAGMLQFVPRAAKGRTIPSQSTVVSTAPITGKPMSNDMFKAFLNKK